MIDDLCFFDEDNTREPVPQTVSIPVKMFAGLVETKARVDVLLDYIAVEKSISTTNIAIMLGNPELAVRLEEDDRKFWENLEKKVNKKKGEGNETTEANS